MASITPLRNRWLARVRRDGRSASKVFDDEQEARLWAADFEEHGRLLLSVLPPKIVGWKAIDPDRLPRHRLSTFTGLYFLYLRGELVYVGKSVNVVQRVEQHFLRVEFDSWAWTPVDLASLDKAERHFIKKHRPRYNIKHNLDAMKVLRKPPEAA
jgi:hypothetical protein